MMRRDKKKSPPTFYIPPHKKKKEIESKRVRERERERESRKSIENEPGIVRLSLLCGGPTKDRRLSLSSLSSRESSSPIEIHFLVFLV